MKVSLVFTALTIIMKVSEIHFILDLQVFIQKQTIVPKVDSLIQHKNHCGNVSILISCQPRLPLHMVRKWNVVEHVGIPKSWGNLLIIGNTGAWLLQKAFKIKLSVGSILC